MEKDKDNFGESNSCSTCTFLNRPGLQMCEMCSTALSANTVDSNQGVSQASNHIDKPHSNSISSIDPNSIKRMIEVYQKGKKIKDNISQAQELIPESFFPVDMLYFNCQINGINLLAFVDTGAQTSVMSKECAELCGIEDLIDYKMKGKAKGVGEKDIVGRIWMVDIDLGGHSLPCSFTILEEFDTDIIFGLNMLISHGCLIDLKTKCLKIGETTIVPFVEKDT